MAEEIYAPLIDDMTWSYSRIKAFVDCKYRFFLKYLYEPHLHGSEMFFSSYGSFMHKLIEQYLKKEKTQDELIDEYLLEFDNNVSGRAPNEKIFDTYLGNGLEYLHGLKPFPYNVIAVEKRLNFNICGYPFVGVIDCLGVDERGDYHVVDNKSRNLKPRSNRKRPTKSDGELDEYLRQLYLYADAVNAEYGKPPVSLDFNCFREQLFISEPYREDKAQEARQWLVSNIQAIREEEDYDPTPEYWKCTHICEMHDVCEYAY